MISIDIDDSEIIAALEQLRDRMGEDGLKPAQVLIGEHLTETTKQRFVSSTAPDGSRWAPNAESTLARLLNSGKSGGKRPLVESGQLADTIRWQFIPDGIAVGTDRLADLFDGGAAVHQLGSKDGRIPARPFLGISDDDRQNILSIIGAHFADE